MSNTANPELNRFLRWLLRAGNVVVIAVGVAIVAYLLIVVSSMPIQADDSFQELFVHTNNSGSAEHPELCESPDIELARSGEKLLAVELQSHDGEVSVLLIANCGELGLDYLMLQLGAWPEKIGEVQLNGCSVPSGGVCGYTSQGNDRIHGNLDRYEQFEVSLVGVDEPISATCPLLVVYFMNNSGVAGGDPGIVSLC